MNYPGELRAPSVVAVVVTVSWTLLPYTELTKNSAVLWKVINIPRYFPMLNTSTDA